MKLKELKKYNKTIKEERKMHKRLKIYLIIFLGLALFYSDFIRDYIFKNLEYQIHYLSNFTAEGIPRIENYTDSWMEKFLAGKSIKEIDNLKWLFTLIFTIYFFIFSIIIPSIIYGNKLVIKYASILYGIIFTAVVIIYSLGFISADFDWQKNTYLIALGLAHFLQSSLPTILLGLAFKLHLSFKN